MVPSAVPQGAARARFRSWQVLQSCSSTAHCHCSRQATLFTAPKGSFSSRGWSRSIGAAMYDFSSGSLEFVRTGGFAMHYCGKTVLVEQPLQWPGSKTADASKVAVFWDLNDCTVPDELDPFRIGPNIVSALKLSGFSGPVSLNAYGNTRRFSDENFLQALIATGVDVHHVSGGENDCNSRLLVDLLLWVKENPPPAHMFLISGDKNYSSVLHKLQMRGYDILWAYPQGEISPALLNAANKVWAWDGIMTGMDLVARSCVNGRQIYTGKLQGSKDVFHRSQSSLQIIPQEVVEQVIDIIKSTSTGLTVGAFRRKLRESELILDKSLYGHKDLLSFLLSIPRLKVSLVWTSNGTRAHLFTVVEGAEATDMLLLSKTVSPLAQDIRSKDVKDGSLASLVASKTGHIGDIKEKRNQIKGSISRKEKQVDEHAPDFYAKKSGNELAADHDIPVEPPAQPLPDRVVVSSTWRKAFLDPSFVRRFLQTIGFKTRASDAKLQDGSMASKDSDPNCGNRTEEGMKFAIGSKDVGSSVYSEMPEKSLKERIISALRWSRQSPVQEESALRISLSQENPPKHDSPVVHQHGETNIVMPSQETVEEGPNKRFSKKLLKEVKSFMKSIEGRSAISKATTMEDLVKLLKESTLTEVAHLPPNQLFQLAKMLNECKELLKIYPKHSNPMGVQSSEVEDTGSIMGPDLDANSVLEKHANTLADEKGSKVESEIAADSDLDVNIASEKHQDSLAGDGGSKEHSVYAVPSDSEKHEGTLAGMGREAGVDLGSHSEVSAVTDSAELAADSALASVTPGTELIVPSESVPAFNQFKTWMKKVIFPIRSIDRQSLLERFEEEFKTALDPQDYGLYHFSDLIDVTGVAQIFTFRDGSAVVLAKYKDRTSCAKQDKAVLEDLKEILRDILRCCKQGFPLGDLKEAFRKRYGYDLNHKALGHKSLSSLVVSLNEVAVVSIVIAKCKGTMKS